MDEKPDSVESPGEEKVPEVRESTEKRPGYFARFVAAAVAGIGLQYGIFFVMNLPTNTKEFTNLYSVILILITATLAMDFVAEKILKSLAVKKSNVAMVGKVLMISMMLYASNHYFYFMGDDTILYLVYAIALVFGVSLVDLLIRKVNEFDAS